MAVEVREVELSDHDAVLACVQAAFAKGDRDGIEEVQIVRSTWERHAAPVGLDIVAIDEGRVVGHVMGGRGRLGHREVIGLAPLSVVPSRQGEGIGSLLVREFVVRAEAAGWPLAVLLGDPRYYARFGFEPSGPLGITYEPVGEANPHFMVRRLAGWDDTWQGFFRYSWEHERLRPD